MLNLKRVLEATPNISWRRRYQSSCPGLGMFVIPGDWGS